MHFTRLALHQVESVIAVELALEGDMVNHTAPSFRARLKRGFEHRETPGADEVFILPLIQRHKYQDGRD
jgi:hypothetical protein